MSWIRDEMDVSDSLRRDELRPGLQGAVHMMSLGDSILLFQRFGDSAMFVIVAIDSSPLAFACLHSAAATMAAECHRLVTGLIVGKSNRWLSCSAYDQAMQWPRDRLSI
jgi:hypothetical protein